MHKAELSLVSTLGMTLFLLGIPILIGFFLFAVPKKKSQIDRA
jgi:hypothetical protein